MPLQYQYQYHSPQSRTHVTTTTSYPSLTLEGDSAFSDMSSMTSSKVRDDGLRCQWDQSSISDSAKDSTATPEEDDDYGSTPPNWTKRSIINGPSSISYPARDPVSGCEDKDKDKDKDQDADSIPSYTWDVYDIRREEECELKTDTVSRDMDICSVVSNCDHPNFGNNDPYDPDDPTRELISGDSTGADKSPAPNSGPEGLSESELLSFLRLLERSETSCAIRYTIEQLITCVPVQAAVETQRLRSDSISNAAKKEIYLRLLHLAPTATRLQVIYSMGILPFIIKALGETAIKGKRHENPTKDRLLPRSGKWSRPSSNPCSLSTHHRSRDRTKSPERTRLKGRPPLRRPSPPGSRRSGSGRDDFKRTLERRKDETDGRSMRCGREKKKGRRRSSSGGSGSSSSKAPVRLPHLEREEDEEEATATTELKRDQEETKSNERIFWKRSRKSIKKHIIESSHIDRTKKTQRRLQTGQSLLPSSSLSVRRKLRTWSAKASKYPGERISSLLDLDFTTPPGVLPHHPVVEISEQTMRSPDSLSPRASAGGREPRTGGSTRGFLLPNPGTAAYKAVIERAATSRH